MDMKGHVYWQIFAEVWMFFKSHMPAPLTSDDNAWDEIIRSYGQVMDKYRQYPEGELAKSLLLCVVDELDRLARSQQIDNSSIAQHIGGKNDG